MLRFSVSGRGELQFTYFSSRKTLTSFFLLAPRSTKTFNRIWAKKKSGYTARFEQV